MEVNGQNPILDALENIRNAFDLDYEDIAHLTGVPKRAFELNEYTEDHNRRLKRFIKQQNMIKNKDGLGERFKIFSEYSKGIVFTSDLLARVLSWHNIQTVRSYITKLLKRNILIKESGQKYKFITQISDLSQTQPGKDQEITHVNYEDLIGIIKNYNLAENLIDKIVDDSKMAIKKNIKKEILNVEKVIWGDISPLKDQTIEICRDIMELQGALPEDIYGKIDDLSVKAEAILEAYGQAPLSKDSKDDHI